MKLSYEQIGRIIDIFNERLATKLEEVGLPSCINKAYIYNDRQSIIEVNYTSKDDKIHAIISISELLAIDFNKFDYHLIINNIGNDVDVEYSIDKISGSDLSYTIHCAYDIIIISSNDVYIQTLNYIHRPEYPVIMTESADIDKECILNAIKNGKMYGIYIIIDRKDNENALL